jgi:hypothetical protein
MKFASRRASGGAEEARAAIERFLESAKNPALLEPGEELIPLVDGCFALEPRNGRLTIEAWDEHRNLTRRIVGIREEARGKLDVAVERFARKQGNLIFVDLARPSSQNWMLRGARLVFRERFRQMILRRFGGWKLCELSTEADLQHSLSPAFPRALVAKGHRAWAAIGASEESDAGGVLTFGLIWLHHVRKRESRLAVEGLVIYVPNRQVRTTAQRLRWLNPGAAAYELMAYSGEGCASLVDLRDAGNLDTRLDPACRSMLDEDLSAKLAAIPDIECIVKTDGEISLRVRGLEFARSQDGALTFGVEERTPLSGANLAEARRLAEELLRLRHAASDHNAPLYRRGPEAWLESQVRSSLSQLDSSLLEQPVYGQVPAFAGGERGVLDLLAADRSGRLVVIELKASADLHLPLQALDYWTRVEWHAGRQEFAGKGYFPGVALRSEPPRLLLVSPALEFHPTTETLLGYFSPTIDVERIGLGVEWRKRLQVLFRMRGAASA